VSSLTEAAVVPAPFRHEALLYAGDGDYLAGTVAFVEAGLAVGEPVLVAVPQERLELLRGALPTSNPLVQMADMEEIGRNPARIIPLWADFALPLLAEGRSVRGIGEPIWPGRSADELAECVWHEMLVNAAFADAAGLSLLCPYDTRALDPVTIDTAHENHPRTGPPHGIGPNPAYRADVPQCPHGPLSPVPDDAEWVVFDRHGHSEIRHRVRAAAGRAGLPRDAVEDAVLVVNEAIVNSVRHAGGKGRLCTWTEDHAFLCEVRDMGRICDPMAGRRRPPHDGAGGRGLWLITQLSDLVQIREIGDEQAVRIRISDPTRLVG
jgi:anti-sigma regulatory factor (Ser/Thr protein kinase)